MKNSFRMGRLLMALFFLSLMACQRTVIGLDGQAYYKVGPKDYVPYQQLDSLDYSIQHYAIVK